MNMIKRIGLLPKGISSALITFERFVERRAVYKKTVAELSQLSERELWDLGLSRGDIRSVASQAARAK